MLGVAAEAEFLRLVETAENSATYSASFSAISNERTVRQAIVKFQRKLSPIIPSLLPKKHFEDVDTNFTLIQSVLRVARNDSGHPKASQNLEREQVYSYLQLFIPFSRQTMWLRQALQ
jgi:hypothetical protein